MSDEPRTPDLLERARLLIDAFRHRDLDAMISANVQQRPAQVAVFDGGLVSRLAAYLDVDQAGAVAERVADERG
jgi:hypothetical protein